MKKSYSTAKNLVLILSYYLSLEKSRVSEDIVGSSLPHEAEEFRHHLKTLQKLIKSKFEIWNGKDDTFKAKYSVCEPSIHEELAILVEKLLREAMDPEKYSKMKDTFHPTCSLPQSDETKLKISLTDETNDGMNIYAELAHELVVTYPEKHTLCVEFVDDLYDKVIFGD